MWAQVSQRVVFSSTGKGGCQRSVHTCCARMPRRHWCMRSAATVLWKRSDVKKRCKERWSATVPPASLGPAPMLASRTCPTETKHTQHTQHTLTHMRARSGFQNTTNKSNDRLRDRDRAGAGSTNAHAYPWGLERAGWWGWQSGGHTGCQRAVGGMRRDEVGGGGGGRKRSRRQGQRRQPCK
jgi:hypothetical protein